MCGVGPLQQLLNWGYESISYSYFLNRTSLFRAIGCQFRLHDPLLCGFSRLLIPSCVVHRQPGEQTGRRAVEQNSPEAVLKKLLKLPQPRRFQLLFRNESQGSGVDAIAQAGGLRAVGKDMAEVSVAGLGADLRPNHPVAFVYDLHNLVRIERLGKAWPSGA